MGYYYYYYNGSSSARHVKDQLMMTPLRVKQQQQQLLHPSLRSQPNMKPVTRKVPVVSYLSRNGQLEHPHFMDVILSAPNLHHLHLKDVMERLTALRGPGMPARYSWSCKRSYKNGYVWNDLAENDVIWPAEGADEYVLKGSELVHGHADKTAALHIIKPKPSDFHPRAKQGGSRVLRVRAEAEKMEEEEAEEENSSNSLWTSTPPSRCSVGISTDDIHLITSQREEAASVSQPQVSTSSSSDKAIEPPVVQAGRNSVLLQQIACGSSTIAKCGQRPKQITLREHRQVTKCNSLKGVEDDDDGVAEMIECMLENPRFGGFQTENKEYFSWSMVEAMAAEGQRMAGEASVLKRSNSLTEERSRKQSILEEQISEEVRIERQMMVTGKCIPRMKKPAASPPHQKSKA